MIDSLVSVRLVTADGNIVEASASENPDLFWAIRGAGPNFGIITSATYKLHKAVNDAQVFTADAIWPASMVSSYFDVLESFEGRMPPELSIVSFVVWDAASSAVSNPPFEHMPGRLRLTRYKDTGHKYIPIQRCGGPRSRNTGAIL